MFTYDGANRITEDVCIYDQPNAKQVTSTVSYVKAAADPLADERVGTYAYAVKNSGTEPVSTTATTNNTFDDLKRVKKKVYNVAGKSYTKTLTYYETRVSREIDSAGITNTYTYDPMGRISKIVSGNNATTYHYDQYGQLVREDNQGLDMTMVYDYNNIGNLISAKKYSYTASTSSPSGTPVTTSFGYTDDKLTTFSGATIAYNSMGCPTTYEGKSLTWTKGKMSQMSSGTLATGTDTYAFVYNAYGQRVSKTYSYLAGTNTAVQIGQLTASNKTYYYDHAGRLISETVSKTYSSAASSSESIVFLYDESGIIGMERTAGGTTNAYYFQRNLQGDVVAIYDTSGNMVAKYLYDAWGNCTISGESTNTAVAAANPIRYRGYYYDDDTGIYYCNARYYSPKWRRFISPDDTSYLDPEAVNGLNLYCYCNNDPVNYADPSGSIAISLILTAIGIGAAIGAGISLATTAITDLENGKLFDGDVTFWAYFGNIIGGGIAGAGIGFCAVLGAGLGVALSTGTTLTLGGMAVSGGTAAMLGVGGAFVAGGLGYAARTGINDQETFEWSDMFIEAGINAFSGLLTFAGAMAGGIMGVKTPGAKFSLKNFMHYHLGATYFGVYPAKALLSILKAKLKEKY